MKLFDLNRTEAVKVVFKEGIFEDDFPEQGMKAWFTGIEKSVKDECYLLYFDFSEFEEENDKYFKADYYDKSGKPCLTAKDLNLYTPKYSIYFGDIRWTMERCEEELRKYLDPVDEEVYIQTEAMIELLAMAYIACEIDIMKFLRITGSTRDEVTEITEKMSKIVNHDFEDDKSVKQIFDYLKKKYN